MKKNKLKEITKQFLEKKGVKPIYICISGAHLYGFPSPDSDYDFRCCHIQPTNDFFHLKKVDDVIEHKEIIDGIEIDIVSFELEKVLNLIIKNNSNVLEHIFAENLYPTIESRELIELAKRSISKEVYNPYHGMAEFNYKKFITSKNPHYKSKHIKKYLYVLRSYLCGIYALKFCKIVPNINELNKYFKYPLINKLVEIKRKGERITMSSDVSFITLEKPTEDLIAKLKAEMELALQKSDLPEKPPNIKELDNFLYKTRLKYLK